MAKSNKTERTRNTFMIAAAIVVLVALIVMLTGNRNRLEDVKIVRLGDGSSLAYYSDEAIIRAAGIKMNSSVSAVEDSVESIHSKVEELGFVYFDRMERSANNAVTLYVGERTPCIAIASGSSYIVTDRDGYIIGRFENLENLKVLKVNGLTVSNPLNGSLAVTQPDTLLKNALEVGRAVIDNNFTHLVSNLSIYSDTYRLIMDTGLIVRFYMGDDLNELLRIVQGFFDEGVTSGEVIVSGGEAALNPRIVDYYSFD